MNSVCLSVLAPSGLSIKTAHGEVTITLAEKAGETRSTLLLPQEPLYKRLLRCQPSWGRLARECFAAQGVSGKTIKSHL